MTNNIALMLSWLSANEKLQENSEDWGYKKLPTNEPFHNECVHYFGCKYCGCVVWTPCRTSDLLDATKNTLVVHAVHCNGVSLGVRVVRAKKYRKDRENAV